MRPSGVTFRKGGSVRLSLACVAAKAITLFNLNRCSVVDSASGAFALRVLGVVARILAWPQEEQGDQRNDWGDASDG